MDLRDATFPLRTCLLVALGFLLSAGAFHLWPDDPCAALPRGDGVDDPLAPYPELREAKGPAETRVLFVGASLTAGFPYGREASFASVIEAGLRPVFPERRILVKALGKPALDSTLLADLVGAALLADPDAVWVVLGDAEVGARLFAERDLVPEGWLGRLSDHATRSRGMFLALAPPAARADALPDNDLLTPLLGRLRDARPARPVLGGLPVRAGDRRALAERTRASVRRMAQAAGGRGVPLALLLSPYNLAGAWPCGMTERARDVDAAVLAFQRGGRAERADALELARLHPQRADVHFLLGRALLDSGEPEAARRELIQARDLDPAPLHLIGEVEEAILREGALLGLPVLAPDEGTYLSGTRVPDPACFLDPGHWSLDGIRRGAAHVAELLAEQGVIPPLPPGWRPAFDAAAADHLERAVDAAARARAEAFAWRSAGLIHALLGNARDGVLPLADGVLWFAGAPGGPDDPEWGTWGLRLVRCAAIAADRSDELLAGTPEAQAERIAGLVRRLWSDAAGGRARELVGRIQDGEDLDALAAPWRR